MCIRDRDAPHPETGLGYQTLGFLAVVAAAFTSGFCGVYQQKILQAGKTNMWVRNAQMGLTSVCLGVVSTIAKDRQAIAERGFFQGYSKLVWTVIVIQAVGGLNIAFILKYADNILKGFAAAFPPLPVVSWRWRSCTSGRRRRSCWGAR